jgi:hypothetical protein
MDPMPAMTAAPVSVQATQTDSTRDIVLAWVSYSFLYWFVGSLIWLTFEVIDHLIPDALAGSESYDYYLGGFSYAVSPYLMASTLVSGIVAIFLMRAARRTAAVESPVTAARVISRLILYVSIAAALALVVGDLIYVASGFFSGDLTAAVSWKAAAVFLYGLGAGWYLLSLRPGAASSPRVSAAIGVAAALAAVGLVIFGWFANGEHGSVRDLRADATRVSPLQEIESSIIEHWDAESGAPASLAALEKDFGLTMPKDPETEEAYVYRVTKKDAAFGESNVTDGSLVSFSICATFAEKSVPGSEKSSYYYPPSSTIYDDMGRYGSVSLPEYGWSHEAGEVCFERTPSVAWNSQWDTVPDYFGGDLEGDYGAMPMF